jgi:hypothetical protein
MDDGTIRTCGACGNEIKIRPSILKRGRKFCSDICRYAATPAQLFWAKVDKSGPVPAHRPELGPCWVWTASTFNTGYGKFRFEKMTRYAHRISWFLAHGEWPDVFVCHECDNRLCVRLTHLFLGTAADNNEDMRRKGRGNYPGAPGEASGVTPFVNADILQIRERFASGEKIRAIARDVGVSHPAIGAIVHRRTWTHI